MDATRHLKGVREGTLVENFYTKTLGITTAAINRNNPYVQVTFYQKSGKRINAKRKTSWFVGHVRLFQRAFDYQTRRTKGATKKN